MSTLTHIALVNYIKNLVDQHATMPENAFYRMDVNEIQGNMRTGINYPCLAMESHEANFDGSTANNSLENKTFAFSILKKPEYGNFDEQNQFLDDCEILGKQFLARMRYDAATEGNLMFNLFDAALVTYHKVGPLYTDALYGYRFEIPLKPEKTSLKVNAAHWDDLDLVC